MEDTIHGKRGTKLYRVSFFHTKAILIVFQLRSVCINIKRMVSIYGQIKKRMKLLYDKNTIICFKPVLNFIVFSYNDSLSLESRKVANNLYEKNNI